MPVANGPWEIPPRDPSPSGREVHAWRIALDRPEGAVGELRRVLSPDEVERADRFHAARDRDRFIVGRASTRAILGRYLRESPGGLVFRLGEHGKPGLDGPSGIEFNLSHSGGLAVLAVALGRRVGVDIEGVRPIAEMDGIVARFFSARERATFDALPMDRRADAFFRTWTSKEAYMKATGLGLAMPLDGFDVEADPSRPPGLLGVDGQPGEAERWTFRDLAPGAGYVGVVAAEGDGWRLRGFDGATEFETWHGFRGMNS